MTTIQWIAIAEFQPIPSSLREGWTYYRREGGFHYFCLGYPTRAELMDAELLFFQTWWQLPADDGARTRQANNN